MHHLARTVVLPGDLKPHHTLRTAPTVHFDPSNPLYIGHMDLRAETVTVVNPTARPIALGGYSLTDSGRHNTLHVPEGVELAADATLTVYCAPGLLTAAQMARLPEPSLLWRNADDSLRRKAVLNDTGDSMTLLDREGRPVAALSVTADGVARHRLAHPGTPRSYTHEGRLLAPPHVLLAARLAALAGAGAVALSDPPAFLALAAASVALDVAARRLGRQAQARTHLADALGVLGDRALAAVLLGSLLRVFPGRLLLLGGLLALDVASHWLQMCDAMSHERLLPGVRRSPHHHLLERQPALACAVSLLAVGFLLAVYAARLGLASASPAWACMPFFVGKVLLDLAQLGFAVLSLYADGTGRDMDPEHSDDDD